VSLLAKFSDLVSRSTGLILLLCAALTILAVTRLVDLHTGHFRLEIDPSANRLLSENNPDKQFYDQARATFGSDEILVIALTSADVFTRDTLERIERMTRRISDVEGVDHVVSLSNAMDIRSVEGGLDIAPFIDTMEEGPEAIKAIRQRVLDNPVYSGSLVSKNGDATALIVYFRDIDDREFIRRGIHDQIVSIVNEEKGGNEVSITGTPHFKVSVIKILMHDLMWMPPLIALILAAVLIVCYRTLLGVIVPLVTVVVGVVLSLGLIAALGYSLSMISVLVPPLLMILGLSYSVHVVSDYHQHRDQTPDKQVLVSHTLKRVLLPVLLTGLTTIAGFASLMVNPIEAIGEFGELSIIGVLVITLVSVTFTPALLRFLDRKSPVAAGTEPVPPTLFDRFIDRVAVFDLEQKNAIFLFSGILFVLGLVLLSARLGPLLAQVTSFTLAHTLTLALSSYGVVRLSPRVVEPLIALSIVYVAVENVVSPRLRASRLVLVFAFGLLHGLGFAGVLGGLGLPEGRRLSALLGFNLGVELGQLAVIAVAMTVLFTWTRLGGERRALARTLSLVIAAVGLFWTIQRLVAA